MLEHLLTLLTELQAAKSEADLQSLRAKLEQYPFKDLLDGTCVITPHGVWHVDDVSDESTGCLSLKQKRRALKLLTQTNLNEFDWQRVAACIHQLENEQ